MPDNPVKYERYDAPGGKPGYRKTTGLAEDVKQIVSDVARAVTPRSLLNRSANVDAVVDGERKREGQSTDSNNKY